MLGAVVGKGLVIAIDPEESQLSEFKWWYQKSNTGFNCLFHSF